MSKENYTVEQAYEDLVAGFEIGIKDLTEKLNTGIKEMGKNEMQRALTSIINYPDPVNVYSERERTFIKNLVALHGLHIQAQIEALSQLQKEHDSKGEEDVRKEN